MSRAISERVQQAETELSEALESGDEERIQAAETELADAHDAEDE